MCERVCINNEIVPFSGFLRSHYKHTSYILAHSLDFSPCGTIFLFLCAQVTWRCVEHPIA